MNFGGDRTPYCVSEFFSKRNMITCPRLNLDPILRVEHTNYEATSPCCLSILVKVKCVLKLDGPSEWCFLLPCMKCLGVFLHPKHLIHQYSFIHVNVHLGGERHCEKYTCTCLAQEHSTVLPLIKSLVISLSIFITFFVRKHEVSWFFEPPRPGLGNLGVWKIGG